MEKNTKNVLTDQSLDISFEPMAAQCEVAGFESKLEPIEFHAACIKREIEMDGKLSDSAWETAPRVPVLLSRFKKGPDGPETDIRVLYSPTSLYIGAIMYEPDMENLVAQFDQHDLGIYNDDCLELIIDPEGRPEQFYHIAVNAIGSIYDARNGKKNWNGEGFVVKNSRYEDKWIIEFKMPFSAFDNATTPEPGQFWGIRFARERHHNQGFVAIPMVVHGSLAAREYLGKLTFDANANSDVALKCSATEFDMGMNTIPVEIETKEKTEFTLRARVFNAENEVLTEVSEKVTAPAKFDVKFPVETDHAMRAVFSLLDETGDSVNSFVLDRAFPFVAPGFAKLDRQLMLIEGGCDDLLSIEHPVYRGAKKSVAKMREAIAAYKAEIKNAVAEDRIVDKKVSEDFGAMQNGFREFKNKYSYLVWQTNPWEDGDPNALPPADYTTDLSLSFKQASNERERNCLIFSGLLLDRRLDLRLVAYSIDESGKPFVCHDRFEMYMEPFVDHNGTLHTQPLIKVPGDIITLTPGQAVRVHVVFNSEGVKSGKYETKIVLKPLYDYRISNRDIPVTMEVWNFTLPETKDWPMDCFFWGPNRFDNDEAAMLRLMHSRHVNWGWTESVRYVNGFVGMRRARSIPEGEKYNPDALETANQKFFETAKELKMKFVFGWGTCNSMEWHYKMDARLQKMGFTHDDFMFKSHLRDEFKKAQIPDMADMRKRIVEEKTGWNLQAVYLSSPPPSGATLQDIEDAHLTDSHKTWTLISGLINRSEEQTKEVMNYFRERDCRIWAYECATTMQTRPILEYYRFFPWFGYIKKVDGVAIWTNASPQGEDGLDLRDGYDEGAVLIGSDRAPIPTKRFEAVAEGLEDVAYMFELDKQLKRLEGKLDEKEMNEYSQLISEDKLREVMRSASQQRVDKWRLDIGSAIDKLSQL